MLKMILTSYLYSLFNLYYYYWFSTSVCIIILMVLRLVSGGLTESRDLINQ